MAIIHNEDGVEIDQNRTFLLHVRNAEGLLCYFIIKMIIKTFYKSFLGGRIRGEFTAYVYAGQLPTGGIIIELFSLTSPSPSFFPYDM